MDEFFPNKILARIEKILEEYRKRFPRENLEDKF